MYTVLESIWGPIDFSSWYALATKICKQISVNTQSHRTNISADDMGGKIVFTYNISFCSNGN